MADASTGAEGATTPYRLVSALVDDTAAYDADGKKLGSVYSFHIDRRSGQVEYAVLSFGGFLGLGQSYHPIPFGALSVDEGLGGYRVNLPKAVLDGGPSYRPDSAPTWNAAYAERVSSYFGMPSKSGTY